MMELSERRDAAIVGPGIAGGFWVYEHDVRPHSVLYGPFAEHNGWISYDDGYALHIAAYRLGDPEAHLMPDTFVRVVQDRLRGERRAAVSVWGRLDLALDYALPGYTCVHREAKAASADVADLTSTETSQDAVRAARRAAQLGYVTEVSESPLQPEHFSVMDRWVATHKVTRPHRAFALACLESHQRGYVLRLDVRCHGKLEGFGLLSFPTRHDAVYLQGFLLNRPGSRAGDSLLDHMVRQCREAGVEKVHLGYTGTESLRRFKAKWGGRADLRTQYKELVLVDHSVDPFATGVEPKERSIRAIRWLEAD
jgi:hypothetical protein